MRIRNKGSRRKSVTLEHLDGDVTLVCVLDGDVANDHSILDSSMVSNHPFSISIPGGYFGRGSHTFTLYAVDSTGLLRVHRLLCRPSGVWRLHSSPQRRSPIPSQTLVRILPIELYSASNSSKVNVVGRSSNRNVSTTFNNLGYLAVIPFPMHLARSARLFHNIISRELSPHGIDLYQKT
jgi:hypothetical protein